MAMRSRKEVAEKVALIYILHQKAMKKKRKYWVHPALSTRELTGSFQTMFNELRENEDKFMSNFHMSVICFDELLHRLSDKIKKTATTMRMPISPTEMLAVTLRYLVTGSTFTELHNTYRMGLSTIRKFITRVCLAVWNCLSEECMPMPTKEKWRSIAAGFQKNANFPNCIGAIDGKLVSVAKRVNSLSVLLLAVVDANYYFTRVSVEPVSRTCDSSIFTELELLRNLSKTSYNIPDPQHLPKSTGPKAGFAMVGDECFSMSDYILRPYTGKVLSVTNKIFNYRASRARRFADCTFAILSNKWEIFHKEINVNVDIAVNIVKACCVLHNFVLKRDGYRFEDTLTIEGLEKLKVGFTTSGGRWAVMNREVFAEYFVSEAGAVPWQNEKIN